MVEAVWKVGWVEGRQLSLILRQCRREETMSLDLGMKVDLPSVFVPLRRAAELVAGHVIDLVQPSVMKDQVGAAGCSSDESSDDIDVDQLEHQLDRMMVRRSWPAELGTETGHADMAEWDVAVAQAIVDDQEAGHT